MPRCAACQAEVPAEARFCTQCGATMAPAAAPLLPETQQSKSSTALSAKQAPDPSKDQLNDQDFSPTLIDQPAVRIPVASKASATTTETDSPAGEAPLIRTPSLAATMDRLPTQPGPQFTEGMLEAFEDAPTALDPLLGRVIAGKFKVEKLLGVGGMGRVYQARHLVLDKIIALKVLHPQYAEDETLVHRFQREARAASRIEHPNIIQIFDFGQDPDGTLYMAMELLRGRDLDQVIVEDFPFTEQRIARITLQIASALGAAHRQGVVHRDLKPANVVLVDQGEHRDFVKLFDFGIAKLEQNRGHESRILTTGGVICGTPEYMSPEQVQAGKLDGRSDIYALGVVLYLMATGRLPFRAKNAIDVAAMHVTTGAEAPRSLRPEISVQLEEIILRCLKKKTTDRYADAGALFAALSQLASGEGEEAFGEDELSTDTLLRHASDAQRKAEAEPNSQAHGQQHPPLDDEREAPEDKTKATKILGAQRIGATTREARMVSKARRSLWVAIAGLVILLLALLTNETWRFFHPTQPDPTQSKNGSATTSPAVLTAAATKAAGDAGAETDSGSETSASPLPPTTDSAADAASTDQSRAATSPKSPTTIAQPHQASKSNAHAQRTDSRSTPGRLKPGDDGSAGPKAAQEGSNRRLAKLLRQGDIRHEAGDYAGALPYYKKALALYPANPKIKQRLILAYFNLGEAKKACAALADFLRLHPHPKGEEFYRNMLAKGCRP